MVSQFTMICIGSMIIVSTGFPVIFLVVYKRKHKIAWRPIIVGALVFIFFSQILEKTLHTFVLLPHSSTEEWLTHRPIIYAIYGGLAAGVFEEIGRYIGFRFFLKKYREWKDGIAYGIGHGGIEAILVGALGGIQYLTFASLINASKFDQLIPSSSGSQQIKSHLLDDPEFFLLGGVERILAFTIQLGLSLLVFYAVQKKRVFLLYAIIIHAVFDFLAVYLSQELQLALTVEFVLCVFAICSLIFIIKSKNLFQKTGGQG